MHKMKASSGPPEKQQAADVPGLGAEEALRKSEERWRSVFENSAIGVALTDLNGRFLATNHVYQKVTGHTEEELRALYFLDITHEDYRQANWALITELVEGKRRQFQIEKKYRRKNGSLIGVSNNVSLVPLTRTLHQRNRTNSGNFDRGSKGTDVSREKSAASNALAGKRRSSNRASAS